MPALAPFRPQQAFSAHSISSKHQGHLAVQVRAVYNADMFVAESRLHAHGKFKRAQEQSSQSLELLPVLYASMP